MEHGQPPEDIGRKRAVFQVEQVVFGPYVPFQYIGRKRQVPLLGARIRAVLVLPRYACIEKPRAEGNVRAQFISQAQTYARMRLRKGVALLLEFPVVIGYAGIHVYEEILSPQRGLQDYEGQRQKDVSHRDKFWLTLATITPKFSKNCPDPFS
jgi:hypothetical protein